MAVKRDALERIRTQPDDASVKDVMAAVEARYALTPEEWEPAWDEEIARRIEVAKANPDRWVSNEEVMKQMDEAVKKMAAAQAGHSSQADMMTPKESAIRVIRALRDDASGDDVSAVLDQEFGVWELDSD